MTDPRKLTRENLLSILEHAQHLMPPRPSQQSKRELLRRVNQGLASERYGASFRDLIADIQGRQ